MHTLNIYRSRLIDALKVALILTAIGLFLTAGGYFPEGDVHDNPFAGAMLVYAAIGVTVGLVPTFIFLMGAIFGEYDRKDNLYRTVVFMLYVASSYYLSPFATNYGEITRPLLHSIAYLLLMLYMVWQLPREKPWVPHLTVN